MQEANIRKGSTVSPGPGHLAGRQAGLLWEFVRRWGVGVGVAAAALSVAAYVATPYILGPVVETARVTRQDIVQTVVASGQVQTPYRVAIGAQITGVVAEVPVSEGQDVRAGDLLIQIDDRNAHEQVKLAQGTVDQAEARLKQLANVAAPAALEALNQAQATLADTQRVYDRLDKLRAQGYATQADRHRTQFARHRQVAGERGADSG